MKNTPQNERLKTPIAGQVKAVAEHIAKNSPTDMLDLGHDDFEQETGQVL